MSAVIDAPAAPPARRPTRWWRVMLLLAVLGIVLLGAVLWGLFALQQLPIHVSFDGFDGTEHWRRWEQLDLAALSPGHTVALLFGLAAALLAVLIVVPLALMVALGTALLGIVLGIGLPVLVLVAITALLCSPLLLLGWGLWALLRDKPKAVA